jgi:predicted membrane protein
MENENKARFSTERHDRFWTGLALIIVGACLLAKKAGADFPYWFFTWPMLLILAGIITGIRHRFQNASWLIMLAIGGFFLSDKIMLDWNLRPYFWPVAIIGVGLVFILRPKKCHRRQERLAEVESTNFGGATSGQTVNSSADVIESVSIFGGVKRVVTSKNFKGGEIICFMGGAEYNLSQADISGPIEIEIIQGFAGTKLIVPPHWEIRSEFVAIFAGIEDKRHAQPGTFDPNKILIIKGVTIFGGIEIKSY